MHSLQVERGSGLYSNGYLRQMEAFERAQRVDSNIQGGRVQILQVGMSVCEGPYGCPFGWGVTLCQYQGSIFKAIFTRCGGVWPAFEG